MKRYHPETLAIRTQLDQTDHKEHATPLFLTSSFTFDNAEAMRAAFADEVDANIYSRFINPSNSEFIDKMCLLEGAEDGYATASGMAAVFASFAALLESGDHLLVCRSIFGSTHSIITKILNKWNISHTYVDIHDTQNWHESIKQNTKMCFVETPSNPSVDLIDLEWFGHFCKEHHIISVVDNCFATPIIQKPIDFGTDLVIHSATKYLDGQGRVLGGVVVGKKDLIKEIRTFARSTGPALSPFNGWLLSKSLETLSIRMEKHSNNALKVAQWLSDKKHVNWVRYPFLESHPQFHIAKKQMTTGGGIVTFEIKNGLEQGKRFLDALEMCSLTANLGDTRTIVTHPASTTHAKLTDEERLQSGITSGLIRISVGLEHIQDIIEDLDIAFGKS